MKRFVQGIVFISLGFTILNCLSAIVEQFTELVNTKIASKTLELQVAMQKLNNGVLSAEDNDFQTGFCSTSAIGVPDSPSYEEYEEDEE